jgi:DNA-binding transcriptional LysR family regulator
MNIKRFRYLEAAIEHGSFRRAAASIGISQPALSEQIRRLEEDLDLVLLTRAASGVRPTEEGAQLLPLIADLTAAERALTRRAEELRTAEQPRMTIGAVSLFMLSVLPRLVVEIRNRHPEVTVEIVESGAGRIEQLVSARELTLGLVVRSTVIPAQHDDLRFVDLATGTLHVTLNADDPLAALPAVPMEKLRGRPMVAHAPQTFLREVFDTFREPYELHIQSVADSGPSTHRLIAGTNGIAFSTATDFTSSGAAQPLVHRPVIDPVTPLVLSIALRADERSTPTTSAIVRWLREQRSTTAWPAGFTAV